MPQKMEYTVLDMIESAVRQAKVSPMILGGVTGPDGGSGNPPGGFVGQLPQKQVTYDTTEAASLALPASGVSLVHNLNRIRFWLNSGYGLRVEDYDGSPSVHPVNRIVFSGAAITNQGYGRVLVAFSGGGGGGLDTGAADLLYLRLDTANSPLTGGLEIIPDTNDEFGLYVETQGDAYPADFEQLGYGGETITVPNLFLYRGAGDGSNVFFNTHQIEVLDEAKPGSTGGFMKYTASGVILVNFNPKATMRNHELGVLATPSGGQILFHIFKGSTDYFWVTPNGAFTTEGELIPERPWFRFNDSDETLEFGTDVVGKEVNSGKIGYESFGAGYLHIVGAGTSPDRRVKLYDKTYCDLFVGGYQIAGMANATMLGTDASNNIIDNTSAGDARWAPVGSTYDGWIERTETWTRTGNHTFTLSGDYTNVYRKGVRVQYVDTAGGPDYGVIISAVHASGTTTVELAVNTDYVMAAGAITSTYVSYQEMPRFFPDFFNFTLANFAASGSMTVTLNSTTIAKFKIGTNCLCHCRVQCVVTTGGTASTQIVCDAPVAVLDAQSYPALAAALDGTAATTVALGVVNGNSVLGSANRLQWRKADNTNWGLGSSRTLQHFGDYPI